LLGRPVPEEMTGPALTAIGSHHNAMPRLSLQRVPERRAGKVLIYLDLTVDDADEARVTMEVLDGQWTGDRHD